MLLLMCLNEEEANYLLCELHEEICGSHVARTSLALKALRNGYFLPTMKVDAIDLIKRCNKCQRHACVPRKPSTEQLPLVVAGRSINRRSISFGPFPITPGQLKYLIVAVKYFIKWIRSKPLITITIEVFESLCGGT